MGMQVQSKAVNMSWEQLCEWASGELRLTLNALPELLHTRAKAVALHFEAKPSIELQTDGIEEDTLGLFTGSSWVEEGETPYPPQIILFLENIWNYAGSDKAAFLEEVRTTFLHELGHYLGLDEEDLALRGLE